MFAGLRMNGFRMLQILVLLSLTLHHESMVLGWSLGFGSSEESESGYSKSSSSSSSYGSKHHSYHRKVVHRSGGGPHTSFGYPLELDFPLGYGYIYASDYDSYDLDVDLDLDPDFHFVDFHYDADVDLDLDFADIELDIDINRLKYGLYGLNHISLHNPSFNDYRFRHGYRYRRRPYYRVQHRYFPQIWKYDLDFWDLDTYSLGFWYDKYYSFL